MVSGHALCVGKAPTALHFTYCVRRRVGRHVGEGIRSARRRVGRVGQRLRAREHVGVGARVALAVDVARVARIVERWRGRHRHGRRRQRREAVHGRELVLQRQRRAASRRSGAAESGCPQHRELFAEHDAHGGFWSKRNVLVRIPTVSGGATSRVQVSVQFSICVIELSCSHRKLTWMVCWRMDGNTDPRMGHIKVKKNIQIIK